LYTIKQEEEPIINTTADENAVPTTVTELIGATRCSKAPGYDGINAELIKHPPTALQCRFLDLLNTCWRTGYIPESGVLHL
jgi:hypothetical protein